MLHFARVLPLAALLLLPTCSKAKDAKNVAKKLDTMNTCFEPTYEKVDALLDVANSWRMNTTNAIADPVGLTWSENVDGSLTVAYTVAGFTINATIIFYNATGVQQDLDLAGAITLNDAIDAAATQLSTGGVTPPPFIVGDWTITGAGLTGSGAVTGLIGGVSGANTLASISTTTATPAGGPPPDASSTLTIVGASDTCTLTFSTSDLETDTVVDQSFPIGTINATLVGPQATVVITITFNNTSTANIVVGGVPGSFDFDLITGNLQYNP